MDTFATAITCIDGRVQQPVADWVKQRFNVRYVDLITEPGPDRALSQGAAEVITGIVRKAWFSINHHHSSIVALAGHDACAANPVSKEEHFEQILEGVRVLISYELPAQIVGLWVNEWGSVDLVWDTKEREPVRSYL
ncbi:MAG: carbonic anhydrase [Pyrinomonadaceae bacterium]